MSLMNSGSVDGILKTFTKAIDQLDKVHEKELKAVDKLAEEISAKEAEKAVATDEAMRAKSVAGKLRDVIA